jgi:hypothetical protein
MDVPKDQAQDVEGKPHCTRCFAKQERKMKRQSIRLELMSELGATPAPP